MIDAALSSQIYTIVSSIPKGNVLSYADVARLSGKCGPRQVGRILHHNPDNSKVPCHRVVHEDGTLAPAFAFGGEDAQKKKLKHEGVLFRGARVHMQKSRWKTSFS